MSQALEEGRGARLSTHELIAVLDDIVSEIHTDDSFEGMLEYRAASAGHWEVFAMYRVGNKNGQGGWSIIEGAAPVHAAADDPW